MVVYTFLHMVFTMSCGKITYNKAAEYWGGVFLRSGTFDRSGREIFGNIASKGNADVYHLDSGDGSSDRNTESPNGSGGSGGLSGGGGFSLRDIVVVVVAVLFFRFKKELEVQRERQSKMGCMYG